MFRRIWKKQVVLPQEHGSWVFVLSPLLIGLFAAGRLSVASWAVVLVALSAFLARQPVSALVKIHSGRRSRHELTAALFWGAIYGTGLIGGLGLLVARGFLFLLWLGLPGALIFGWHLYLVYHRAERHQIGIEIVATGALALAAPAALWAGMGSYQASGWWLWLLCWLQAAASIVYVFVRLEQRRWEQLLPLGERWKEARRAFLYASFNLALTLGLGAYGRLPGLLFVPFLLQWGETLWGIYRPAWRWKPTRIGLRQLIVSTLWTILFILSWKVG